MTQIVTRVLSLLIGYVCGHFITGYFLAKREHIDLKHEGSGNVGSTNTMRTMGVRKGLLAFAGDMGKVFAAGLISWLIFRGFFEGSARVLLFYAGMGAILGHVYPVYLKGGGGKGVACTAAMVIMSCPVAAPLSFLVFVIVVLLTRYVSLGSIIAELSYLLQLFLLGQLGYLPLKGSNLTEAYIISVLAVALSIFKHSSNIKRLIHHEEKKFTIKKKTQGEQNESTDKKAE